MRATAEFPGSGKHSPDDLFTAKGGGGKAVTLALQPGLEGQYIHVSHWRGGGNGAGGADVGLGAGVPLTTTTSNPVCRGERRQRVERKHVEKEPGHI